MKLSKWTRKSLRRRSLGELRKRKPLDEPKRTDDSRGDDVVTKRQKQR